MATKCEKKFEGKKAVLWLLALFSCVPAYAVAVPRIKLEELVSQSDVVAVGEVATAQVTGKGTIQSGERIVSVDTFSADFTVIRLLKGEFASQGTIRYLIPSGQTMGYRRIGKGVRLLFLRHSDEGLTVTDPYYPFLPATATQPSSSGSDPIAKVIDELSGVLVSETADAPLKQQVLDVAYAVPPNDAFTVSLRRVLDTPDLDLRYRVMANLVRRHDADIVPRLTELLMTPDFPERYRSMFEYVIATCITDPAAVPFLDHLVHSPHSSTRAAVVEAFWHIGTSSVTPSAIAALTDPDQRTRYYAVRALAATTGQTEWGPSIPEFDEHEKKYIQHWLDWAKAQP